jgi:hypothetical protein
MSQKPLANNVPEPESNGTASILTDLKSGGSEQSVMPDLGGVTTSAPGSKFKVHSQTLVIALVLAASGGALYMMRKQGMGAGIRFDPPKIDYDMNKISKPADEVHARQVIDELEKSQSQGQVAGEKIQKNPFQLDTHGPIEAAMPIDPADAAKARQAAEDAARDNAVKQALTTVELNATMVGNTPLARINGKIAREGDMVADVFKLKEVQDRSVVLESGGKLYVVNISENVGGKPRPPMPRR